MTVLYIEDNEQNFYLVDFILTSKGFKVFRAHDGMEGLNLVSDVGPDLILLDIQLPGMDGYTVARELRKKVELEKVPIIALTSYAMEEDREKAMAAGCTDHIEKPINPKMFFERINKHIILPNEGGL